MSGVDAKSARWSKDDPHRVISDRVAAALVEAQTFHGYTEREMCAIVGVTRHTWRCATNRQYPGKRGTTSLLTLRDFLAIAEYLKLDPLKVLGTSLRDRSHS